MLCKVSVSLRDHQHGALGLRVGYLFSEGECFCFKRAPRLNGVPVWSHSGRPPSAFHLNAERLKRFRKCGTLGKKQGNYYFHSNAADVSLMS